MSEQTRRVSRELFLAAIGGDHSTVEPWVSDRLTALFEEEQVAAGDAVFAEGEPPDQFFFVREGSLEVVRKGSAVETVEGPRSFGYIDAFLERPRSTSAYALGPLSLLKIRVDAWLELLEDSFELARMSVRGLARSVAALEVHGSCPDDLGRVDVPARGSAEASLDVLDRLAILMRTPPLGGAGVQPINDLASMCEERSFDVGEQVFEPDAPYPRVFVVVRGSVEAFRKGLRAPWRFGPGQVVTGFAPFAGMSAEWEARAVTRTRALTFLIDDWWDVLEENFEMVRATLVSFALELDRAHSAETAGRALGGSRA